MRITYKAFDSKMASREKLFKAALEFANKLEPKQIINITHTEDRDNIVLTVWYWTTEVDKEAEAKVKRAADIAKIAPGGGVIGGDDVPKPGVDVTQQRSTGETSFGNPLGEPPPGQSGRPH